MNYYHKFESSAILRNSVASQQVPTATLCIVNKKGKHGGREALPDSGPAGPQNHRELIHQLYNAPNTQS
jgi:hypothetical protein